MAYRITGRVLSVGNKIEIPTKSGNTMTKRDLIINVIKFDPNTGLPTADESNTPKFTFIGEKANSLENLTRGDVVRIDFEIAGRSYEKDGRTEYITEARPFRIDVATGTSQPVQSEVQIQTVIESERLEKIENNDLPF